MLHANYHFCRNFVKKFAVVASRSGCNGIGVLVGIVGDDARFVGCNPAADVISADTNSDFFRSRRNIEKKLARNDDVYSLSIEIHQHNN